MLATLKQVRNEAPPEISRTVLTNTIFFFIHQPEALELFMKKLKDGRLNWGPNSIESADMARFMREQLEIHQNFLPNLGKTSQLSKGPQDIGFQLLVSRQLKTIFNVTYLARRKRYAVPNPPAVANSGLRGRGFRYGVPFVPFLACVCQLAYVFWMRIFIALFFVALGVRAELFEGVADDYCDPQWYDCSDASLDIVKNYRAGKAAVLNGDESLYVGSCYMVSRHYHNDNAHYGYFYFRKNSGGLDFFGLFSFFNEENPYANMTLEDSRQLNPKASEYQMKISQTEWASIPVLILRGSILCANSILNSTLWDTGVTMILLTACSIKNNVV